MARLALALAVPIGLAAPLYADNAAEGVVVAMMSTSDRIDLLPGQAIIFVPDRGKMTFIRFVQGPMEPEQGELKLEFTVTGGQSNLVATNKTDTNFHYRAQMLKKVGAKKGKATSVCTIIAGGSAFENWRGEITVLRVMDFKAVAEDAIMCR